MRHGSSCGCPDCEDFHPTRFDGGGAMNEGHNHPMDGLYNNCRACIADSERLYHATLCAAGIPSGPFPACPSCGKTVTTSWEAHEEGCGKLKEGQ